MEQACSLDGISTCYHAVILPLSSGLAWSLMFSVEFSAKPRSGMGKAEVKGRAIQPSDDVLAILIACYYSAGLNADCEKELVSQGF